ncbi:MAG: hypothetical protein ACREQM_09690 [Candidatus Dormibacteraceae bacterium]
MEDRPVAWDATNRRHLFEEHAKRGLSEHEIDEAMADPQRRERWNERHETYEALGQRRAGRWLFIAWISRRNGRYSRSTGQQPDEEAIR